MQERLIENWLTNVNERAFELPFAQLLASEGYSIIHLSRHGPFEDGKDLIAKDPDGVPCAFQLKGGNVTQSSWSKYLSQVTRLIEIPINHPSINQNHPRRVFFVTTGELSEEVRTEIKSRNIDLANRDLPILETIVKGELIQRFKESGTNFWPVNLEHERSLLEFFLADGRGNLPKRQLSEFVTNMLPINERHAQRAISKRALASSAIVTSLTQMPYQEKNNHVALIESWTIYLGSLIALAEKQELRDRYWRPSFDIAMLALERSLDDLWDELANRDHFVEGLSLLDGLFYRGRMTKLMALISAFGLYQKEKYPDSDISPQIAFVREHLNEALFWGEGATSQLLAIYWFIRKEAADQIPDHLLYDMIGAILELNETATGLADPYHEYPEVMMDNLRLSEKTEP